MSQPAVSRTGLVTGEAVVLDLRPARLGSRSIALALDLAVQAIALVVFGLLLQGLVDDTDPRLLRALTIIGVVVFLIGYPIVCLTYWQGRTLGKAAMGIRAVRTDGGTVRARHAATRTVAGLLEFPLGIAVLASLFSPTGRRLGDFFAGTAVVHDRIPLLGRQVLVMPPPLVNWALAADLNGVDERLATDVRSFLGRAPLLRAERRWELASAFAVAVAARVTPPPPAGAPPEHVLHAVMAERQRRQVMRAGPVQQQAGIPGAGANPAYRQPPTMQAPTMQAQPPAAPPSYQGSLPVPPAVPYAPAPSASPVERNDGFTLPS